MTESHRACGAKKVVVLPGSVEQVWNTKQGEDSIQQREVGLPKRGIPQQSTLRACPGMRISLEYAGEEMLQVLVADNKLLKGIILIIKSHNSPMLVATVFCKD